MYSQRNTQAFQVRLPSELHQQLKKIASLIPGTSMNDLMIQGAELALTAASQEYKNQLRKNPLVQEILQEELNKATLLNQRNLLLL